MALPATRTITRRGAVNDRRRKIRMSRNALSRRCRGICRRTKAARPISPTAIGRYGEIGACPEDASPSRDSP
jgi:hypothetical protein